MDFSILCLTTDLVHQGHERRKKKKSTAQHVRAATRSIKWEAVTSRCLGNGRSDVTCKQYGGVSASYKQFSVSASYKQYVSDECTYNIQSRQKHNMLSLLHAAYLKLLVFFLFTLPKNRFTEQISKLNALCCRYYFHRTSRKPIGSTSLLIEHF